VAESVIDPRGDFERSVPVWRAVLEAAVAEAPDCHVVLASSAAVYDPSLGGAVSEESDCRPGSPYGVHKLECEQLGQEFSRSHGLRVSVARVFNVYGPWMRRQVLWDWCRRAWGSAEGLVRALGSADASRDFIQVSDVAEAILRIAEAPGEGPGVFNVGSGKAVRVGELADLFVEHWPQPVAVAFEQKEAAHSHSSMFADVSRLRRLGFQASVPLADGVREYISWFRGMATKGNPERLAALTPCR
jgi:UDP-glucose 4-epimerase